MRISTFSPHALKVYEYQMKPSEVKDLIFSRRCIFDRKGHDEHMGEYDRNVYAFWNPVTSRIMKAVISADNCFVTVYQDDNFDDGLAKKLKKLADHPQYLVESDRLLSGVVSIDVCAQELSCLPGSSPRVHWIKRVVRVGKVSTLGRLLEEKRFTPCAKDMLREGFQRQLLAVSIFVGNIHVPFSSVNPRYTDSGPVIPWAYH